MFEILEIIASGTFGTVCVARDLRSDPPHQVALKVLKPDFIEHDKVLTRTRDEARMLYQLDHPNIVHVYELLELEGRPIVVMEWVRGISLQALIEAHPSGLRPGDALELARLGFLALHAAYTSLNTAGAPMGIIHRDIKPSNLLLDVDGQLKVVDFGIAHGEFEDKEAVTMSMVLGTRAFSAPERLDGHIDAPSGDVYALGMTLYELFTGQQLKLSMHPLHHDKALSEQLLAIHHPQRAEVAQACRALVADLCHYFADKRPTHAQAAERIAALQASAALSNDLPSLGSTVVRPLFEARPRPPLQQHPHWVHVVALHSPSQAPTPPPPNPQDDQAVRTFISQRGWEHRGPELRRLLRDHPGWTPAPFLEVLDRALVPSWQFWRRTTPPRPAQLLAALDALRERRTPAVLRRAKRLQQHSDRQVRNRARALSKSAKR